MLTLVFIGFTLLYDTVLFIPVRADYFLTKDRLVKRAKRDKFHTYIVSPSEYTGTGYDRGHVVPASDMMFDKQTEHESFYMVNIAPQVPSFNRTEWRKLEECVRAMVDDTVFVVTGTIRGETKIGRINVPSKFYKALNKNNETICVIMQNKAHPKREYITIDSLESLLGMDVFNSDNENKFDTLKWKFK